MTALAVICAVCAIGYAVAAWWAWTLYRRAAVACLAAAVACTLAALAVAGAA